MATAPELLSPQPDGLIRTMIESDVAAVGAIERAAYQFPWSDGIFRDCLRVGYVCRVVSLNQEVIAYGVMSIGAGEAHILNLCVDAQFRCRGIGKLSASPPHHCCRSGRSPSSRMIRRRSPSLQK